MHREDKRQDDRRAGTTDEDGKIINPHIPKYIAQAPWYLNQDTPGLKHQRSKSSKMEVDINEWYQRGQKTGPAATKFRKGACTNCGALTHDVKFCCERPRKIGAKYTGKNIQADEVVTSDLSLDFDSKRDRWNGYEPESQFSDGLHFFDKMEQERRKKKKEEELNKFMTEPDPDQARYPHAKEGETKKQDKLVGSDSDSESDAEDDDKSDFLDTVQNATVGVKKDAKTRTTVRNLRIREDTAKYLRNLDPDSAFYDPKSRSMRDNPTPHIKDAVYAGDNFVRASGDVTKFNQFQIYAYKAYETGENIHMQAVPSQAELVYKGFKEKTEQHGSDVKEAIIEKYGGQQYLEAPKLGLAQTEDYVEYRYDGSIIRGNETGTPKSKYEEDVILNNHTKIWGSYFEDGQWGFACCKNLTKNSYCTGRAGIAAKEQIVHEISKEEPEFIPPTQKQDAKKELQQIKDRFHKAVDVEEDKDERKRSYNSLKDNFEVTSEEMETYQLKKKRFDDPMASFIS